MTPAGNLLLQVLEARRQGAKVGAASLCTANGLVLEAAFRSAAAAGTHVLVESTANQVNQFGGYTGMLPHAFRTFVEGTAHAAGLAPERLHLGGDHLGPLVWADRPEAEAMPLAKDLVRAYVAAGFGKIHLDTSMRLGDDAKDRTLPLEVIARRGANLCRAAEDEARNRGVAAPVYVIGSEVPIPGGAVEEEECLAVTSPVEFLETVTAFRTAFVRDGLESAWERVVAFVVQPGVEFSDASVHAYDRSAAKDLVHALDGQGGRVFEGHSTDYQTRDCLKSMVEDGIAVLKVGPALTFALREGLFALNRIEEELLPLHPELEPSRFAEALDEAMVRDDTHWRKHHRGSDAQKAFARRFGLSDRSRYYLPVPTVQASLAHLLSNLEMTGVPQTLISQYLPTAYRRIRDGEIGARPRELAVSRVMDCLSDYSAATATPRQAGRSE